MEKDTLRTGWNNLTQEILIENELKKYQPKLTPPRKCSTQDLIKALKKLDTLTLWGQLIININKQIHIIPSYMTTLAYNQSIEWVNHIFALNPNISLDELIENNSTDLDSQIALTRTWLQLIRNVQYDNIQYDTLILKDIKKQISPQSVPTIGNRLGANLLFEFNLIHLEFDVINVLIVELLLGMLGIVPKHLGLTTPTPILQGPPSIRCLLDRRSGCNRFVLIALHLLNFIPENL